MITTEQPATKTTPAKGVQVTEKALAKIRRAIVKEGISPEQGGLRLGVQGGGCSGLSYNIVFRVRIGSVWRGRPCPRRLGAARPPRFGGASPVQLFPVR